VNASGSPHLPRTDVGAESVIAAMQPASVGIVFSEKHFSTIYKPLDGLEAYTLITVSRRVGTKDTCC
jgi:hypothetical protein